MPSGVGGLSGPAPTCADPDGGFQENTGDAWRTYGPGGNGNRNSTPCSSPSHGRFRFSFRFFIFVFMSRAIVFILDTIEVSCSFLYRIGVVAILLGAGGDRSGPDSDRKSSFSGPRRGLRRRPGTSGGARRVPARPNLENRRQLLRNDPLRPPFLALFVTPTPPPPPGPYTLEYLRFEGIPPFDPHASCHPGSADSQA